jgi:chorismate-pyruvate lyase
MDRIRVRKHARGGVPIPVGLPDSMTASESSDLRRMLLDNPGTVTHLLEALTGEPIVADVVRQYSIRTSSENGLGVAEGQPITHRMAVLRGGTTDLPYIYAESRFLPGRLPEMAQVQLDRTSDPIGRVLVAHGLKAGRQVLPQPGPLGSDALSVMAGFRSEVVWSRAYRLIINELPVFAICEWFFRSVLEAMDREAQP